MKRPTNFEKINCQTIRYRENMGAQVVTRQHNIDIETKHFENDITDYEDGIFVMTAKGKYRNVLHFRINWKKWKDETAKIRMHIVPHGEGTNSIHHIDCWISEDDIKSMKTFKRWIRDFCSANDRLLRMLNKHHALC